MKIQCDLNHDGRVQESTVQQRVRKIVQKQMAEAKHLKLVGAKVGGMEM